MDSGKGFKHWYQDVCWKGVNIEDYSKWGTRGFNVELSPGEETRPIDVV